MKRDRRLRTYILNPIRVLAEQGKLAGILLIITTVISLTLSNSSVAEGYLAFWQISVGFEGFRHDILFWINDGLMPLFFLLVGIEIKRELLEGELSSFRKAMLPAVAAVGGMIFPALIYISFNSDNNETINGWAIPTATDIAFSLGILSLLGKRVPFTLKVFLTALAIIDDLGAIVIIAAFYSHDLQLVMLGYAGIVLAGLILTNLLKIRFFPIYIVLGLLLWYFILKSGIHPTIAGVLLAFTIPVNTAEKFETKFSIPVYYFILPVFALANTAVALSLDVAGMMFSGLSLGIIAGLFIGKPLGILAGTFLLVKMKISKMLEDVSWVQMLGLGLTAGIGFTMSIFISTLSFKDELYTDISKLAIIAGSLLSAILGLIILRFARVSNREEDF